MKHATKRSVGIALIIVLIGAATAPANASGDTGAKGDLVQSLSGDSKASQGAGVDTTLSCTANAAPVPQYSASNRTVQWGAKVICNLVGTILINTSLATVAGTGDKEHYVTQDSKVIGPTVNTNAGNSWGEPCLSGGSARWIAFRTPTWNGLPFDPPTQSTNVITMPCTPIPG